MTSNHNVVALTLLLGVACGPEFRYETEQMRIALGDDIEAGLCAGDLRALQDHVDRVEARLGMQMDRVVDVTLFRGDSGCEIAFLGCYDHRKHEIHTNITAIQHELVHAVTRAFGPRDSDRLFSEGIAVALEAEVEFPSRASRPSDNLGHDRSSLVRYETAGHFTRWLLEEHGAAAMRSLLSGADFRSVYGETMPDAEERWLATAPWLYPKLAPCEYPPLQEAADGWSETITLDCGAEDTRSDGYQALASCRRFDVREEGLYLLESELPVVMGRCNYDTIMEPFEGESDAIPPSYDPRIPARGFDGGERELLLRAGPHWACVSKTGDQETTTADFHLTPTAKTIVRPE